MNPTCWSPATLHFLLRSGCEGKEERYRGIFSPSLLSPRHQTDWEGSRAQASSEEGWRGQTAGVLWCLEPSPGLSAPAKGGEPELCSECKELGELPAGRRRRRPQPWPNEKTADNLFSNPGSGAGRGRVAWAGGGVVPLVLSPAPAATPPPPAGSGRAQTHFLTISEHTLAVRPPAAPQLLSPARRAQSCRCAALLRLPAARRRRGAWRAGGQAAGPGLGGRKREAEEK